MSGITQVIYTDMFWSMLEQYRNSPRYELYREKIEECILNKSRDRGFRSNSDYPFTGVMLKNYWHCVLSRTDDAIFIYTMEGDKFVAGAIGGHELYGYNGKNVKQGAKTAAKIVSAIARGHMPVPNWTTVKWSDPAELLDNRDLNEASFDQLKAIHSTLTAELDHPAQLEKVTGMTWDKVPDAKLTKWVEDTEAAHKVVAAILAARPLYDKANKVATPVSVLADARP